MASARREVPTVFVRGKADRTAVRAIEDALTDALRAGTVDVDYSVLWIETDAPGEIAVEIELGTPDGAVGARSTAATMRDAGAECIARAMADLTRVRHA